MSKRTVSSVRRLSTWPEGSIDDPAWVKGHMERWLARNVHDDQIEETRAAILRALAENPRLVDWHSWPEIAERGR